MQKNISGFLPPNVNGLVFDIAILLINIFLIRQLSSRFLALIRSAFQDEKSASLTLPVLAAIVLLLRLLGLYFKRRPLQARLNRKTEGSALGCLGFFNFGLMALTLAVAMVPLMEYAEKMEATSGGTQSGAVIVIPTAFIGVFLLFFEWWLFVKALSPLKSAELASSKVYWMFSRKVETLADFGLFVYMMLWQVIYNAIIIGMFTESDHSDFGSRMLSLAFFTLGFCACYLTPRALFLVEDAKYRVTWLTMGMAFLPSAIRILINR